eukprot:Tamp_08219.p1 GENE.Tamp_08219~~Tamp_08219.p1  ORF type:complete len:574 (-),score=106.56 Tamp_08219:641-2230(-)
MELRMRGVRATPGRSCASLPRRHCPCADPAAVTMSAAKEDVAHSAATESPSYVPGALPKFDKLDKTILLLSVPAIVNFMLVPLVGAADTFWVGKMNNAAALAGTGGANQIYSTTFWVLGFLPSVITPLVAQAYGAKDMEGVQRHIGEALFLSTVIGLLGCAIVTLQSARLLGIVIPADAPAMAFAVPYFLCRGISFLPAMLSTVGFATFRGTLDTVTPLAVSAFSNIFHILLLPLLIFNAGLGVVGAGIATVVSDLLSSAAYLTLLFRRGFVKMSSIFRVPHWGHIGELLKAGFAVQLRTLAMNAVFIAGAANIQAMDLTGTAAAAHTITTQFWSLGGTVLLALSTVAAILVPRAVAASAKAGNMLEAQTSADRLLVWGLIVGVALAGLQMAMLPMIQVFTPLVEVQEASKLPFIIASLSQIMNGVTFVGEGIMQGHRAFLPLAVNTLLGAAIMMVALQFLGGTLPGVWASFMVFNACRLTGVLVHHFFQGPLALHKRGDMTGSASAAPPAAAAGSSSSSPTTPSSSTS